MIKRLLFGFTMLLASISVVAQEHSIAREWNEEVLHAVRNDFARPTIHARNLFHSSVLMYDAWALFEDDADTYFLGKTVGDFTCAFDGFPTPDNVEAAREEALSYAVFRLMKHRFAESPGWGEINYSINNKMTELGYDKNFESTYYIDGNAAALGNYMAAKMIEYGQQDGSNEAGDYANLYYEPVNDSLQIFGLGNEALTDPNRWQPLYLQFEDQSGNLFDLGVPDFLSPEWGNVDPFSMTEADKQTFTRDGDEYIVYHDPGMPPLLDTTEVAGLNSFYKWNFVLVSIWGSHLDPEDGVIWDISPASIGNNPAFPTDFSDYDTFYDLYDGGDPSAGWDVNPHTGLPYEPQYVPRADYARVLAEFWADGPESETPPGHWFTILNYVNDHEALVKKWNGTGEILSDLEWDVKTYFSLGGTMHDAAIAAWGIKGYYDYIRPVSAIRYMAELGQCTDVLADNYHPGGIPLIPGYIETVEIGDPLAGPSNEYVGEIKVFSWKGHEYIEDPITDEAGVGWILAGNWWPYQRPTFVTPPFAGFVSGHSTFSRAAAELMTLMTGDAYFPGGMGVFDAELNEFLVFENGPSVNMELQWATYRDASDQCSLSRIWGGIHPPADDIPGRIIGAEIGPEAYNYAVTYFSNSTPKITDLQTSLEVISDADAGSQFTITANYNMMMDVNVDPILYFPVEDPTTNSLTLASSGWIDNDSYSWTFDVMDANETLDNIITQITSAVDLSSNSQVALAENAFSIDTQAPNVVEVMGSTDLLTDMHVGMAQFEIGVTFDEKMDAASMVNITFPMNDLSGTLTLNLDSTYWSEDGLVYIAIYDVLDDNMDLSLIDVNTMGATDAAGNPQMEDETVGVFSIDMKNPEVASSIANTAIIADANVGMSAFEVTLTFDEPMETSMTPEFSFNNGDPLMNSLALGDASQWLSNTEYMVIFDANDANESWNDLNLVTASATDANGNVMIENVDMAILTIDTENPTYLASSPETVLINDETADNGSFTLSLMFSEAMDMTSTPEVVFDGNDPSSTLVLNSDASGWIDDTTYDMVYNVMDDEVEMEDISFSIAAGNDAAGNTMIDGNDDDVFTIDTKNPTSTFASANTYVVNNAYQGEGMFNIVIIYDENMDEMSEALITFPEEDALAAGLSLNMDESHWINSTTYVAAFDVDNITASLDSIDVQISMATDNAGNEQFVLDLPDFFSIQLTEVSVEELNVLHHAVVFPNPASSNDFITLRLGEQASDVTIDIYDISGKLVESKQLNKVMGDISIGARTFAPGIYFMDVQSNEGSARLKLEIL